MTRDKCHEMGLLFLRLGIGVMFMIHGYPKLFAGPEAWTELGSVLPGFGIRGLPTIMGLLAALSEFVGGLLLIIGLLTRAACFFLLCTMSVATYMHISNGDSFQGFSHALEAGILFFSFIWIGAGKYSLDRLLFAPKPKEKASRLALSE